MLFSGISYKARRRWKNFFIASIALALLLVIVWMLWMLWLDRYVVYTREGAMLDFSRSSRDLSGEAVKFTEPQGKITVYMAEKGGKLQFNIINTGSEIPPEQLKFIFDRFYKGDSSRNRNSTGSGLGLYITKTVIKQHGGDIFVRSSEGKTEFCFTLPLAR